MPTEWIKEQTDPDCQGEESMDCLMTWALEDKVYGQDSDDDLWSMLDDENVIQDDQFGLFAMPMQDEGECKTFFDEFLKENKEDATKFEMFTKMMIGHDIENKDDSEDIFEEGKELASLMLDKLLGGYGNSAGQMSALSTMILVCFSVLGLLQ